MKNHKKKRNLIITIMLVMIMLFSSVATAYAATVNGQGSRNGYTYITYSPQHDSISPPWGISKNDIEIVNATHDKSVGWYANKLEDIYYRSCYAVYRSTAVAPAGTLIQNCYTWLPNDSIPANCRMIYMKLFQIPAGSKSQGLSITFGTNNSKSAVCITEFTIDGKLVYDGHWINPNGSYAIQSDTTEYVLAYFKINDGNYADGSSIYTEVKHTDIWNDGDGTQTFLVFHPYTITLDANGGSGGTPAVYERYQAAVYLDYAGTQVMTSSQNKITVPTRVGYTFNGYYYNGVKYIDSTGAITSAFTKDAFQDNVILTASWTPKNYTLSFNANGGSVSPSSKTVTYDAACGTLPTPTRAGYRFDGWFDSAGKQYTASTVYQVAGNTTVTAKWTALSYAVNYNSNGGTGSVTSSTATYDANFITRPNAFTRAGYQFNGWKDSLGSTWSLTSAGVYESGKYWKWTYTQDITLYAQWANNTYYVSYQPNKPSNASSSVSGSMANTTHSYDVAANLRTNAYGLTGWRFSHWNTRADGTGTSYSNGASVKNLTTINGATIPLYAQWVANTYNVTYNANGGTGTMANSTATYDSNFITRQNAFNRDGYTFNGWNENSNGTGVAWKLNSAGVYESGQSWKWTYTKDITLYAQWKANSYNVLLDDNGATSTDHTDKVKVDYLTTLPDIVIPKQEFLVSFEGDTGTTDIEDIIVKSTFNGYYDENNKQYYDETGKGVTWDKATDYTLVAKWTPGEIDLPDCDKPGFDFIGWDDDPSDPDNPIYEPGDTYIPEGDTPLYPVWKAEITIYDIDIFTYDKETGTGILNTHKGSHLVGSSCTATEQIPAYIEYGGYVYKASTTIVPTMNREDNVIYRFYEPVLSINAQAFDANKDGIFSKKEAGLLDVSVTGYPSSVNITFPDSFKNTKWTNPVTGNFIEFEDNTTVTLNISQPALRGRLEFPFMTPDTNFNGMNFSIIISARREDPCELFQQYVVEHNLEVTVETECAIMLDLGMDSSNFLSRYLSSIRSFGAYKK